LASEFRKRTDGSALVEFAAVMPILLILLFGGVDFAFAVWQRAAVVKAAEIGARRAIVTDKVATNVFDTLFTTAAALGGKCMDASTSPPTASADCAFAPITCGYISGAMGCSSGAYNATAFADIYNRMVLAYPQLKQNNVSITYASSGLGFVGGPNGVPATVTVSISCLTYDLPFTRAFLGWALPAKANGCPADALAGWVIRGTDASLTSEDFDSSTPP
jgi:Flp pilus assembly protein TadG